MKMNNVWKDIPSNIVPHILKARKKAMYNTGSNQYKFYQNVYTLLTKNIQNARNKKRRLQQTKNKKESKQLRKNIKNIRNTLNIRNNHRTYKRSNNRNKINIFKGSTANAVNAIMSRKFQVAKDNARQKRGGWATYIWGGYNKNISALNAWKNLPENYRQKMIWQGAQRVFYPRKM